MRRDSNLRVAILCGMLAALQACTAHGEQDADAQTKQTSTQDWTIACSAVSIFRAANNLHHEGVLRSWNGDYRIRFKFETNKTKMRLLNVTGPQFDTFESGELLVGPTLFYSNEQASWPYSRDLDMRHEIADGSYLWSIEHYGDNLLTRAKPKYDSTLKLNRGYILQSGLVPRMPIKAVAGFMHHKDNSTSFTLMLLSTYPIEREFRTGVLYGLGPSRVVFDNCSATPTRQPTEMRYAKK